MKKLFIYFLTALFLFMPMQAMAEAKGCGTKNSLFPQPKANLFSIAEDIEAGKTIAKRAEEELEEYFEKPISLVSDEVIESYLADMLSKVLIHAPDGAGEFEYSFILYDHDQHDVRATPGGTIIASLGAVAKATDDDAVAFMLAHEVGHVYLRHFTRKLSLKHSRGQMDKLAGVAISAFKEPPKDTDKSFELDIKIFELSQKELQDLYEYPNALVRVHETEADIFSAFVGTEAGFRTGSTARFYREIPDQFIKIRVGRRFSS